MTAIIGYPGPKNISKNSFPQKMIGYLPKSMCKWKFFFNPECPQFSD
jgi:hypothetical protein